METRHTELGQLPGKSGGLSPNAKALVRITASHFDPKNYGDHAELLGVGSTFTPPSVKEGAEYAYEK